jgi:hypothetical protein
MRAGRVRHRGGSGAARAGRSESWRCGRADEAARGERTLRRFAGGAGANVSDAERVARACAR